MRNKAQVLNEDIRSSCNYYLRILYSIQEMGYEDFLAFLTNSYLLMEEGIIFEIQELMHTDITAVC